MSRRLLIDDLWDPAKLGHPEVARTWDDAKLRLSEGGWDVVYLDNDLGEGQKEGWELLAWMMREVSEDKWPRGVVVFSANSPARQNISSKLRNMGYEISGKDERGHPLWLKLGHDHSEHGREAATQTSKDKVDVLYVVHPDAIAEQQAHIKYVKPFLDKITQRIKSFPGPVIVSKLDRNYTENRLGGYIPEQLQGIEYAKNFLKNLGSNVHIIEEVRSAYGNLGMSAALKILDDLYLENRLGTIILGGCFIGGPCPMCIDLTKRNLIREYGENHVKVDNDISVVAGMITFEEFGENLPRKTAADALSNNVQISPINGGIRLTKGDKRTDILVNGRDTISETVAEYIRTYKRILGVSQRALDPGRLVEVMQNLENYRQSVHDRLAKALDVVFNIGREKSKRLAEEVAEWFYDAEVGKHNVMEALGTSKKVVQKALSYIGKDPSIVDRDPAAALSSIEIALAQGPSFNLVAYMKERESELVEDPKQLFELLLKHDILCLIRKKIWFHKSLVEDEYRYEQMEEFGRHWPEKHHYNMINIQFLTNEDREKARKIISHEIGHEIFYENDHDYSDTPSVSKVAAIYLGSVKSYNPSIEELEYDSRLVRNYEQIEKELEKAYARNAPQSVIDRLETELAHHVTEEDVHMSEEDPTITEDVYGHGGIAGAVEEQLAHTYANYLKAPVSQTIGIPYTKQDLINRMRNILEESRMGPSMLSSVTDAQVLDAAKDAYQNRHRYIQQFRRKKGMPTLKVSSVVEAYLLSGMDYTIPYTNQSKYYEIYKDPTESDIDTIIESSDSPFKSVRVAIDVSGDMYAWNGDLVHDAVARHLHKEWVLLADYMPSRKMASVSGKFMRISKQELAKHIDSLKKVFPNLTLIKTSDGEYLVKNDKGRTMLELIYNPSDVLSPESYGRVPSVLRKMAMVAKTQGTVKKAMFR